ncbi:MAG: hypothetical protein K5981_07015, partial [Clostridia bacterium]|nr:hypothetical protein [Clostridia bacterium]
MSDYTDFTYLDYHNSDAGQRCVDSDAIGREFSKERNGTMKKARFLALFLCLTLALGFLPPKARAANRLTLARRDLQTHLVYGTNYIPTDIVIWLDLDTMKATASFVTKEAVMNKESTYTKEEYAWIKDCENQSATVSYDIKTGGAGDDYKWLLTNAAGADSFIWGVDRYSDSDYRDYAPYAHKKTVHCHFTSYGDRYEDMDMLFYYPEELFIGADNGHIYDYLVKVDRNHGSFGVNRSDEAPTPAQPEKREYTMQRDNFGFYNGPASFFKNPVKCVPTIYAGGLKFFHGTYGYLLDDSAVNAILSGRTPSQRSALICELAEDFQGACYGMAITSGLLFEGKIALNQFGGSAADVYHLKAPWENEALARTLSFYQVNTCIDLLGYEGRYGKADSAKTTLAIVKALKDEPEHPVVVCFSYTDGDGAQQVRSAHAVLAFKVEDASGDYKYDVSVYDPNVPKEAQHIMVKENGDAAFASCSNLHFRTADKAKDLYDATLSYPAVPAGMARIRTDGGAAIETDGQTTTVQNGQVTGNQDVTAEQLESSDETVIYVPVKSGQSIRVRRIGGTSASIQTDNEFVLFTDGAEEVTLNPDGSVTAKTDGTEGSLGVASDKTKGNLFGTTVETKAAEVTVTPTGNGANVTTSGGTAD